MAAPPNADEVKLKTITLERVTFLKETKELGRGAYGKVYPVKYGGVKCAAKELHENLVQFASQEQKMNLRTKFIDECHHMKLLVHPNIVYFIGIMQPCHESQSIPIMVMEFMPDGSLTKFIEDQQDISYTMKGSILIDVAQGLEYLHTQNIIHRDLTPNNILLKHQTAEFWIAKISDFGMAKIIDATSNSRQSRLPGMPDFMPPEAFEANPYYTTSLDVFSYGGNMLFVASGIWPRPSSQIRLDPETKKPMEVYSEVQRRQYLIDEMSSDMEILKPMIELCLDNNPKKRPAIKDIVKDLKKQMFGNIKSEEDSEYLDLDTLSLSEDDSETVHAPSTSEHFSVTDSLWFMGPFPDKETEGAFEDLDDGVFGVRKLNKIDEKYEICLRWKQQTQHIAISVDQSTNYCWISPGKYFATVNELIQYYTVNSLSSVIAELDTTLKTPYWNQYGKLSNPVQQNSDDLGKRPKMLQRITQALGLIRGSPKSVKGNKNLENYDQNDEDSPEQIYSLMIPVEIELWYYDNLTRFDVIRLLKADGDYLVRFSEKKQCYVLTTKSKDECLHIPIQKLKLKNGYKYGFEGPTFFTIGDLLKHYVENQIPIARHIILKRPVCKEAASDDLMQHIINHDDIILDKQPLSKGIFGDIYFAQLKKSKTFESVTVKKCNTEYTKNQFLYEAKILKLLFGHQNILNLLGVCVHREPVYIVMENVEGNNLECFLDQHGPDLNPNYLAKLSFDAAQGMEYLVSKNCVHCDLAARNCIIAGLRYHQILKISDFSLCQLTKDGSYIPRQLKDVPFEWMSPEVIKNRKFTSASDVWSYGVLLFEIYNRGVSKPYIGKDAEDAYRHIKEGYRLDAPKGTPNEINEVMKNCWEFKADKRPTFKKIVSIIKCFLNTL